MLLNIKKGDFVKLTTYNHLTNSKYISKEIVDKVNELTLVVNGKKYCRKTGKSKVTYKNNTFNIYYWTKSSKEELSQQYYNNNIESFFKNFL